MDRWERLRAYIAHIRYISDVCAELSSPRCATAYELPDSDPRRCLIRHTYAASAIARDSYNELALTKKTDNPLYSAYTAETANSAIASAAELVSALELLEDTGPRSLDPAERAESLRKWCLSTAAKSVKPGEGSIWDIYGAVLRHLQAEGGQPALEIPADNLHMFYRSLADQAYAQACKHATEQMNRAIKVEAALISVWLWRTTNKRTLEGPARHLPASPTAALRRRHNKHHA